MSNKILILGSKGLVGNNLYFYLKKKKINIHKISDQNFDISIKKKFKIIDKIKPNIIINCAAYTDVRLSETNKRISLKSNYYGVINIVDYCKLKKIKLIHLSSDYVYNGKNNYKYKETDKMNPINYYGYTKSLADNYIIKKQPNYIIIRTSSIISGFRNCFLKKIYQDSLKKKYINLPNNLKMNPTFLDDLVECIYKILKNKNIIAKKFIILNFTNKNTISWYLLAKKFLIYCNKNSKLKYNMKNLNKINYKNNEIVKRPINSALSLRKISSFGIKIVSWEKSFFLILKRIRSEI